jgi:autotransporter-associated beta strand protein
MIVALVHAVVCGAASAQSLSYWGTYQGDAAHDGYVPVTVNPANFFVLWHASLGSSLAPVAEGDGEVFFVSGGTLGALSAASGATLWQANLPSVSTPPAYANGIVYAESAHQSPGGLYAYNAATGNEVFQSGIACQCESYFAPTPYGGNVYIGGGYTGGMYSFNATTGAQNWFANDGMLYHAYTPAVDGTYAYIYVGNPDSLTGGLFTVVNMTTGAAVATVLDPTPKTTPYTMNFAVALGARNDAFVINPDPFTANDSRLVCWTTPTASQPTPAIAWSNARNFTGQPSVAAGVVYAIDGGNLDALSEATGELLWTWNTPPGQSLTGTLVVTNSDVFASSASTTYAIDLGSHQQVWSYAAGGQLALSEGVLYIAGPTGNLTAIEVASARVSWTGATGGNWDASTANWAAGTSGAAAYSDGNAVVFGDTNALTGTKVSNTSITISGSVSPQSVTFSNTGAANGGVDYTIGGGAIAGSCMVTANGPGSVTLTGSNAYTGGTQINGGTLRVGNTSALGAASGPLTMTAGTLDLAGFSVGVGVLGGTGGTITSGVGPATLATTPNGANSTFGGTLTGPVGLTLAGSGTLTLTGSNTYTGTTTICAGTLAVGGTGSLGLGGTYSGAIANGGALVYSSSTTQALSGAISGTGSLVQTAGDLLLSGSNTYSGGTTISGGTLQLGDGVAQNAYVAGNIADNAALVFANPTAQAFAGVISGAGSVMKSGTGTLTLSSNNTYAGGTTVSAGTVTLASTGAVQNSTVTVNAANGLAFASAGTYNLGALAGSANVVLNNTAGTSGITLSTGANGATTTFSGVLSGSGSLIKVGAGALTLSASNTYSGGTTVSGGTLQLGDGASQNGYLAGNVTDSGSICVADPSPQTLASIISGSGSLTKSGTGTLTLTASNTYSGGTLQLGDGVSQNGYIVGNIADSAALTFANPLAQTFAGVISGGGSLTKSGAGTLTFSSNNTYSGGTTVSAGAITLASTGAVQDSTVTANTVNGLAFAGAGTYNLGALAGSGSLVLNNTAGSSGITLSTGANGATTAFSGVLSGSGSLIKAGTGRLSLSASNTYSGGTTVSGGTLQLGDGILQNGYVAGNITDNGSICFADPSPQTFAGIISGSGNLTKSATGTLTLTGSNTYSGGTTITAGTLQLGDGLSLCGYVGGNITDNSLLSFANPLAQTFAGRISGTGSLTKSATGTLTLTGGNTFSGGTSITAGVLSLANSAALQQSTVYLAGGSLNFGGLTSATFGGLAGGGSPALANTALAPVALTVGNNGASTTFSGVLRLGGSLIKVGGGTLTLTGSNNYNGGTTVSAGAIAAGGPGTLSPYSDMTVSGGTLDASGYANTVKSLTMAGAGTLDVGIGNLLTCRNAATLGGTLNLSGVPGGPFVELMAYGWETGTFATVTGLPGGHTLQYNDTELDLVPEPSTFVLLGAGAVALGGWLWRRRAKGGDKGMRGKAEG